MRPPGRPYDDGSSPQLVRSLVRRARALGADLAAVEGQARDRLIQALDDAAGQPHWPGYPAELLARPHHSWRRVPTATPGTCKRPHRQLPHRPASGPTLRRCASSPPRATTGLTGCARGGRRRRAAHGDRRRVGDLPAQPGSGADVDPDPRAVPADAIGRPQLLIRIGRPAENCGPGPSTRVDIPSVGVPRLRARRLRQSSDDRSGTLNSVRFKYVLPRAVRGCVAVRPSRRVG